MLPVDVATKPGTRVGAAIDSCKLEKDKALERWVGVPAIPEEAATSTGMLLYGRT
jgi:hypothetical protein